MMRTKSSANLWIILATLVTVICCCMCNVTESNTADQARNIRRNKLTWSHKRRLHYFPAFRLLRSHIYHSNTRNSRRSAVHRIPHRGTTRRYITTRTTEPRVVRVGEDRKRSTELPKLTTKGTADAVRSSLSTNRHRSSYTRYSSSKYYQRMWVRNGREYICTTCSSCLSVGLCEQRFLYGSDRRRAMQLRRDNGCYESTTDTRYEQGIQYVRVMQGQTWRCMCEGGPSHRIMCQLITRCHMDGMFRNRGDVWYKYSDYGYRMKCICYGAGSIAKWKCGTNTAEIDEHYRIAMAEVCLDHLTSSEIRSLGETWTRVSKFQTREDCECVRQDDSNVIECITMVETVEPVPIAANTTVTSPTTSPRTGVCYDQESGIEHAIDTSWRRRVDGKFITCRCAAGRATPAVVCDYAQEGTPAPEREIALLCVIGDNEVGKLGDTIENGHSWNVTRSNGTAASCVCVKGTTKIACTPLCTYNGIYVTPGNYVTDGEECVCYDDGNMVCEDEVTFEVLRTCDDSPCWPGVRCSNEENGTAGFTCGPCPNGFTGDGETCSRIGCIHKPCFEGVKCRETDSGFKCGRCPIGFYGNGTHCIDVRIRCAVHKPCAEGVECEDTTVGVECGPCPPGFSGDGYTCDKIIERCKPTTCASGVECTDTDEGAECGPCPTGFSGNGRTCLDVRERCEDRPCAENVICTNTETGVECGSCPQGFSGDGRICEDVRLRCSSTPCHRLVTCADTSIGVDCGPCPVGFSGDGFDCVDVRPRCADGPCFTGVTCSDTDTGVECGRCPTGFVGNGMECVDVRVRCSQGPCAPAVECTNTKVGVECGECPDGFEGDGYACVDKRERCDSRSCFDGVPCFNTPEGVGCGDCPPGFSGDGVACNDTRQRCKDRPCFRGVSCTDTDLGVFCGACPPGYEGDGFECEDFRPRCTEKPCYPRVKCRNTATGVSCGECPMGFSGDGFTCVDERERCSERPCFRGSPCRNTIDGVRCGPCPAGFVGDGRNCTDVRVRCSSRPCFHGVTCVNTKVGVICGDCPAGFSGDGFTCMDIRERCKHNPCFPGVNCTNSDVGVTCGACPRGYVGNGRNCEFAEESCHDRPCFEEVTCTDTDTGVKCGPCPRGHSGDGFFCVEMRPRCSDAPCHVGVECEDTDDGVRCGPCPPGLTGTGFYCTPVRRTCDDNPCHRNVRCRNTRAGVECGRCPRGMSGDGFFCANLPLCADTVCPVNSICRDTENKAVCISCPPGYESREGKCEDRRERCAGQPCHPGVSCNDTDTGVMCGDCPEGYTGDGKNCVDMGNKGCDGPIPPCFAGVECTDTENGAVCGTCPTGYTGNGIICSDLCHTKRNPCFKGVRCYHSSDGITCGRCPKGMVGDGLKCEVKKSCRDNPCYPGVECTDTRSGKVSCGDCPAGFEGDGYKCRDLRIWCDDDPCWDGVTCTDTNAGAKCASCPSGYIGDGMTCVDVDECALHSPCSAVTTCTNTVPGFYCDKCPAGLNEVILEEYGIPKQVCESDNPCLINNGGCVLHSECIFAPQSSNGLSRYCGLCNIGYRGNQTIGCYQILCQHCCEHAYCTSLPGNLYTCDCDIGWAGDGIFCGPDRDFDGFPDVEVPCETHDCSTDNCPDVANMGQEDLDGDGIGNYCDSDADNDGILNADDNCWLSPNPDQGDEDGDSHGDVCDNCPSVRNYHQRDTDDDGIGDDCDDDIDGDGIENQMDICPNLAVDSTDYDGDVIGDECDNCPRTFNVYQLDVDQDGIGDMCDTEMDSDGDGIQDDRDNCAFVVNPEQLDTDQDGYGDACDDDDDDDGVPDYEIADDLDIEEVEFDVERYPMKREAGDRKPAGTRRMDNCRLISNPNQTDSDGDGIGDECEGDMDGDGVDDDVDVCVENPNIQRPDFSKHMVVLLDPDGDAQMDPYWVVFNKGREMLQTVNSDPGMAIGKDTLQGVDYSGTVQVNTKADDDYLGIIFSFQSNARFYAVLWKQHEQDYWWPNPFSATARTGLQLKVINSKTGPGSTLRNAIWHTGDTENEVRLLWHDQNGRGWRDFLPYRFHIIHRPSIGYIRIVMKLGGQVISDSGKVIDNTLKGGRLGLLAFSQEHIIWSDLTYRCNETIPEDYYVGSNEETNEVTKKKI